MLLLALFSFPYAYLLPISTITTKITGHECSSLYSTATSSVHAVFPHAYPTLEIF